MKALPPSFSTLLGMHRGVPGRSTPSKIFTPTTMGSRLEKMFSGRICNRQGKTAMLRYWSLSLCLTSCRGHQKYVSGTSGRLPGVHVTDQSLLNVTVLAGDKFTCLHVLSKALFKMVNDVCLEDFNVLLLGKYLEIMRRRRYDDSQ